MSFTVESAIPEHLRAQRSCPMTMKKDWTPPYPSYAARFDPALSHVGLVILGVQGPNETAPRKKIHELCQQLMTETQNNEKVKHRDQAEFIDRANMLNRIIVCYFEGNQNENEAVDHLSNQWLRNDPGSFDLGFYVEQIWPSVDRVETLYSSDHLQGVAHLAERLSGEVQEHGYWGSARDRLPAAQTDPLQPSQGNHQKDGAVVHVREIHNLCLIRSGQDWSETTGDERRMYQEQVEPVLADGMEFLTYRGEEAGCIANRYVQVLDEDGTPMDQSYGMSWWHSMKDLDDWARAHPTHKAIFGVAMRYLGEHGGSGHLKLTHEVFVIDRAHVHFQYLNCHPDTGVLPAA